MVVNSHASNNILSKPKLRWLSLIEFCIIIEALIIIWSKKKLQMGLETK